MNKNSGTAFLMIGSVLYIIEALGLLLYGIVLVFSVLLAFLGIFVVAYSIFLVIIEILGTKNCYSIIKTKTCLVLGIIILTIESVNILWQLSNSITLYDMRINIILLFIPICYTIGAYLQRKNNLVSFGN